MTPKWLNRNEYPFASNNYAVKQHKLHYVDEGKGQPILFVHGTPSWSFDFRHQIKTLRSTHRCIAPDHMGFGLSDKPKVYDYSTLNHSRTLEDLVLYLDLRHITLVVHDFGGPIGLNFALRNPERIQNIVILNSWMWSSEDEPDFKRLRKLLNSPLLPLLYRYFNFSPRFVLPRSFGDKKLSPELWRQYTRPFSNASEREGALAFARSLVSDQAWFQSLWEQKELLAHKKKLLIWGMKDPVIKSQYLERFAAGFPNASVLKLETCGHFPQEEEAHRVTEALKQFLL